MGGPATSAQRMARQRREQSLRGMRQYSSTGLWPDERALVVCLVGELKARRIEGEQGQLKDLQDLLVNACVTSDSSADEYFTHAVVSRRTGFRPVKGFAESKEVANEMARRLRAIGWSVEIFTR